MDVGLDDRRLRRIIAMLVALAVLAERTAGRAFPVRWFVLSLLRYAEGVARAYVVDLTQWEWPGLDDDLEPGSSPMDAALLGLRLRMLAAVLGALLGLACRQDGVTARVNRAIARADGAARRPARRLHVAMSGNWPNKAPDTS